MPSSRAAMQLTSVSSMNRHSSASIPSSRVERQLVDLAVGLAHADERRVDDRLEDLVDRQLRAPHRLPLADVVGQHRHPVARVAQLAPSASIIGSFGLQRLEVDLLEAVQRRPVAELGLEAVAEHVEEALLGDPPALELEQRVRAVELLGAGRHRPPELLSVDPGVVLEGGEGPEQRRW